MDTGFCLWMGAGVTVQIAGSPKHAPQWPQLTSELERLCKIGGSGGTYPERLEACAKELGDDAFHAELRHRYYTQLGMVLLERARQCLDEVDFIPHEIRQVASLGQAANPIVNFNIEPLTSILISRPAGPMRVLSYTQPHKRVLAHDEASERFRRLVYHPHGIVTGSCVMTKSQYDALGGTLAFELAVHAAFGNILAIVGMSLDDRYLREQISAFRTDLNEIFWFNSTFNDEPAEWARANNVDMLAVEWPDFWKWWFNDRSHEVHEGSLCAAWYRVLNEALNEAKGGAAMDLWRSLSSVGVTKDELLQRSRELGERGTPVQGYERFSDLLNRLTDRIQAKGFTLPQVATSF
jgi:SIR2-like protein